MRHWVVLHLLKDPVETDNEIEAVHDQTHSHEADEGYLFIA